MRRIVPSRIAEALERARPTLEEYISRHLEYPPGFPFKLSPAAVSIPEFRKIKVVPMAKTDLPPVRVELLLKMWLANRAARIRGDWDPGVLDTDLQLMAHGTVPPSGTYDVDPQSVVLKAWWRDMALTCELPGK